jgi:hypothetical protein
MPERHVMVQVDGGFSCTVCPRRVELRTAPRFARVVVEPGEAAATHDWSAEGIGFTAAVSGAPGPDDRRWLEAHGMDWEG